MLEVNEADKPGCVGHAHTYRKPRAGRGLKVPVEGVEPTRPLKGQWILNPSRLPVPPHRLWEWCP